MATDANIETEVRFAMQRMSPAVAALAHATGEEPQGNRRARRKAAAQARKGIYVMPPIRDSEPHPTVPPGIVAFFDGVASMAEAVARSAVAREIGTKAALAAERTLEWMRVNALQGRIIDTFTPEQRAAHEAAVAEGWRGIEAAERAAEDVAGNPAPVRLTDAYGNRFFEIGDLVTRDGTDVHRVVDHNGSDGHAPDGMTVVCVKAPSEPWTKVGEEEFNTCRRYDWIEAAEFPAPIRDADLPAVGSFG